MAELPKVIYVMGPPGAGKGTQAEMLAKELGYVQFSTGDAFRRMREQDTPLGRRVKEIYDKGILQPPELAAQVVIEAVKKHVESGQGLVFDGTPRTMKESEMVDQYFAEHGLGRPLAIHLKIDRDEMMQRILKRRFCLGTTQNFPVVTKEDEQRCEAMGGTVGKRVDDKPEELATRWEEHMRQTNPVVEKYRAEGIVHETDGLKSIEEVHRAIMEIIEKIREE